MAAGGGLTATAAAITGAAPALLGAVGLGNTGVTGGSLAASLQGALCGEATPAGGLFANCTSAAMGGEMGVSAVAVPGGADVAAVGSGYLFPSSLTSAMSSTAGKIGSLASEGVGQMSGTVSGLVENTKVFSLAIRSSV